jgi:hypothetical protein
MTTFLGASTTTVAGVKGTCDSPSTIPGIYGVSSTSANGVYGQTGAASYAGVAGVNTVGSGGYGVLGQGPTGVSGTGNTGVAGTSNAAGGAGVEGFVGSGSYAGYFSGNVYVNGTLSAANKAFTIDHPLDPANKVLVHASIESSERRNLYDGVVVADASGEIEVQLPSWFEALNEDFRYQLTALGAPAPNLHVKSEIKGGCFVIGGANAGQRISWLVSGRRSDPTAKRHPLVVEREKVAEERGLYLDPEAYEQPREKGIAAMRHRRALPPVGSTRGT